MELRWIILLALWTLLAGPIFQQTSGPHRTPHVAASKQ
jgi:hypothetical protein